MSGSIAIPAEDPYISIIKSPPKLVFINAVHPAYLDCEAIYTGPPLRYNDYDYFEDDIEDEKNEENETEHSIYFGKQNSNKITTTKSDNSKQQHGYMEKGDSRGSTSFQKRELRNSYNDEKPLFNYRWYRNDELLPNQITNNFKIFSNGTLKIKYSQMANGIYRCLVNCTIPNVGAMVSNATEVKIAGKKFLDIFLLFSFFSIRKSKTFSNFLYVFVCV